MDGRDALLVDGDEQQLVVRRRVGPGALRGEKLRERRVAAVPRTCTVLRARDVAAPTTPLPLSLARGRNDMGDRG